MKAILILPALCLCALLSAPVTAQMIIRVDGDNGAAVPPNADGEDWGASAYKYLRDAIARAESVLGGEDPPPAVHIWVKGNTQSPYLPNQSELGHLTGSAALEASFVLSDGISIFGGFAGTEGPLDGNLRDHTANVTILCGDLNQDDDDPQTGFLEDGLLPETPDFWTEPSAQDNVFAVVRSFDGSVERQLDGFVIRRGGNIENQNAGGAGCRVQGSRTVLTRCTLSQNRVLLHGGAVYAAGGALLGGGLPTEIRLWNCEVFDNYAEKKAGGLLNTSQGGFSQQPSRAEVLNTLFHRNRALAEVGAILNTTEQTVSCGLCDEDDPCDGSEPATIVIVNSTIVDNHVIGTGRTGGVRSRRGVLDITNSVLWGNSDGDASTSKAHEQLESDEGFGRLRHSCIETDQAGIPQYSDCDTGNIDDDPEFVDPDATDPRDRDYRLQSTSPCRDTGDTVEILLERWRDVYDLDQNGFVEAPTPDLDLTARRKNCHVDMGAYEYDPGSACPYDLDDDGQVGFNDLLQVLASWGSCPGGGAPCPYDFDESGDVGFTDVLEILSNWGSCAGAGNCAFDDAAITVSDCMQRVGWNIEALMACIEAAMIQQGQ